MNPSRSSGCPSRARSEHLVVVDKTNVADEAVDLGTAPVGAPAGDAEARVVVELRDDWTYGKVQLGDKLYVITCDEEGHFGEWTHSKDSATGTVRVRVDAKNNLLILYPHTLVNGTTVAESFMCARKAVLNVRHRPLAGRGGGAALRGMLTHELFQRALRCEKKGVELAEELVAFVEDLLKEHIEDLYIGQESEDDIRSALLNVVPSIVEWKGNFIGHGVGKVRVGRSESEVMVTAVRDIEEPVWSPTFGLKGKIDATVNLLQPNEEQPAVSALELKTGKSLGFLQVSHRAQIMLYSLLLSDRYDDSVTRGLLSYIRCPSLEEQAQISLRNKETRKGDTGSSFSSSNASIQSFLIHNSRSELIAIIMERNRLAQYLNDDVNYNELPSLLMGRENICAKCFVNDSCLLQYKLCEQGPSQAVVNGPGEELYKLKTGHLTEKHRAYYQEWGSSLFAEETQAIKSAVSLWSIPAHECERNGKCIADLVLASEEMAHSQDLSGDRILQMFRRHPSSPLCPSLAGTRHIHGYVIVSLQNDRELPPRAMENVIVSKPAVVNGFIKDISRGFVSVVVDRDIGEWMIKLGIDARDATWRIDAVEILASFAIAKQNLELLFAAEDSGGSGKLRSLIVDLEKPRFKSSVEGVMSASQRDEISHLSLNEDQQKALTMSLTAQDYSLILGMPGTGKTTTLAAIIISAVHQNKSVLLCSHTHVAVDNVLVRLLDLGFDDFIRLGRRSDLIDPRIRNKHVGSLCDEPLVLRDLQDFLETPKVVGTTCLGINHPIFVRRTSFDLVVVDEASQIPQPICIGPLRFAASTFVLVGDHYQLPPLVRVNHDRPTSRTLEQHEKRIRDNEERRNQHESLFRRLCEAHPEAVTRLSKQYRMCSIIMSLCNEVIYGGKLSCGSEAIAQQKLSMHFGGFQNLPRWLKAVRNPVRRVVFLDTDSMNTCEKGSDIKKNLGEAEDDVNEEMHAREPSRNNILEARIIMRCIKIMLAGGMTQEKLVVLTPFRAQALLLKSMLEKMTSVEYADNSTMEVKTIDQYQGKDKDCVLVSFVRSNKNRKVGLLLRDWRRINVAITRAKSKLILIGSASTLSGGSHLLKSLVDLLTSQNAVVPVTNVPE